MNADSSRAIAVVTTVGRLPFLTVFPVECRARLAALPPACLLRVQQQTDACRDHETETSGSAQADRFAG
jgi:hypothetical protein